MKNLELKKDEIIRLYSESEMSLKSISKIYGVSHSTIHSYLKKWNIELRPSKGTRKSKYEENKEEMLDLYFNKMWTATEIGYKFDVGPSQIQYLIHDIWGYSLRGHKEKSRFKANYDFFSSIKTEEQAYWLGFMYADGYITQEYVGISLKVDDSGHLEKFKSSISSNHEIKQYISSKNQLKAKDSAYSRIMFKSSKMCEDLKMKGCYEKKSLILSFPDESIIAPHLIKHFIRGYFDGDGSLILSKGSINFKICGTKEFLEGIIDSLNQNIEGYFFKTKLYQRKKTEKNSYYLSYGGRKKTLSVMTWLYEGSTIYLERKHELYEKLKLL